MQKPLLYLMLGYPGAGKTTAAKAIGNVTGAVHLWADKKRRAMFRQPTYSKEENHSLYELMNKQASALLQQGRSVVFDTNFSFYDDREKLRQIAKSSNADCLVVWVNTDLAVARSRATKNTHTQDTRVLGDMQEVDFARMSQNLQPPTRNEKYIQLDGTKISDEYVKKVLPKIDP